MGVAHDPSSPTPGAVGLAALRDKMEEQGPPWGNPALLASSVQEGYEAGFLALAIAEAYSRFDDAIAALSDARPEDYQELQRLLGFARSKT
jgi:hypothetical protein